MSTTLERWGYRSFWDVMVLGAGLYGAGFSVANMVGRLVSVSRAAGGIGFLAVVTYAVIVLFYLVLAFFPAAARLVSAKSKGGLLSNEASVRTAILFLGAYTTVFLSLLEPMIPWAHVPVLVVLLLALLSGRRRGAAPPPKANSTHDEVDGIRT